MSEKTTVAAAQNDATARANALTSYLKTAGVDAKDIQTSDYSINPQYDYQNQVCPTMAPGSSPMYCGSGKQVLRGYQVRQTTTVKVRDTTKAGDILAGVGSKGATDVSGLSFTFDDPTGLQAEARDLAIADARKRAKVLAGSLGVTLVRVVSFNENSGGYAPRAYAMDAYQTKVGAPIAAPDISVGQNKLSEDVTVVYEIR